VAISVSDYCIDELRELAYRRYRDRKKGEEDAIYVRPKIACALTLRTTQS
jgi:hypothetical protein